MSSSTSSTTNTIAPPESIVAMLSTLGIPGPIDSTTSSATKEVHSAAQSMFDPLAEHTSTSIHASSSASSTFRTDFTSTQTLTNDAEDTQANAQQGTGGLDTGAAAGIGVGATLGVVALIVGMLWFLWKWRTPNSNRGSVGDKAAEEVIQVLHSKPEKDGTERFEARDTSKLAEADENGRSELDARSKAAELEGSSGQRRDACIAGSDVLNRLFNVARSPSTSMTG